MTPAEVVATDGEGNVSTTTVVLNIQDNTSPIVQPCKAPFEVTLGNDGTISITVDQVSNGFSDNCNVTTELSQSTFSCADLGPNMVELTVADEAGNMTKCTTTVTVRLASCPSDIIVNNDFLVCGAVVNYANCGTLISGLPSGSVFPVGTTPVVMEIQDENGQLLRCDFNVTVVDNEVPFFITEDQTVDLTTVDEVTLTANDFIGPGEAKEGYRIVRDQPYNPAMLTAGATDLTLRDDQLSELLPIGFSFDFFGVTYTDFYISSNGFITFLDEGRHGCCSGGFLPGSSAPSGLIAFAWVDLRPNLGGTIKYETMGVAPNRTLVVEFDEVPYSGRTLQPFTGQIKLFEGSNRIEIHSGEVPDVGRDTTQGLENADGTVGIAIPERNSEYWSGSK